MKIPSDTTIPQNTRIKLLPEGKLGIVLNCKITRKPDQEPKFEYSVRLDDRPYLTYFPVPPQDLELI